MLCTYILVFFFFKETYLLLLVVSFSILKKDFANVCPKGTQ